MKKNKFLFNMLGTSLLCLSLAACSGVKNDPSISSTVSENETKKNNSKNESEKKEETSVSQGSEDVDTVNLAMDKIKLGEYSSAIKIIEECTNEFTKSEFSQEYLLYLKSCRDEFEAGTLDYDRYILILSQVELFGFDSLSQEADILQGRANYYKERLDWWNTAEKYYSENEFENAYKIYNYFGKGDKQYSDALVRITDCKVEITNQAISSAEEYAKDNNFDKAIDIIQNALYVLGYDETELTSKMDYYYVKEAEKEKTEILAAVMDWKELGYWSDVLRVLLEEGYTEEYNDLEEEFINNEISNAKTAFDKEGYESAIQIIINAINLIEIYGDGGCDELYSELSYYNEYVPVDLLELDAFQELIIIDGEETTGVYGRKVRKIHVYDVKANTGEKYDDAFYIYGEGYDHAYSNDTGILIYKLQGKYDKISGDFFINYQRRNDSMKCSLKIYGDGILLGEYKLTQSDDIIKFDIDISGVSDLKIVVKNDVSSRMDFTSASAGSLLANVQVVKLDK